MTRILFQGDSITDCGRTKNNDENFKGSGYPHLVMGHLNFENPGQYEFYNRGIGGNKIVDIYARMKRDLICLKPDVMSILVGVNDIWHEVQFGDGVDEEKFEKIYDMLLTEVKEALPDIKIIIMGAFVLKSTASAPLWDAISTGTKKRAEIAKKLAEKHGHIFVDLQSRFDEAIAKVPEPYWTREGVHPTEAGHELIKRAWLEAFEKIK